MPKVLIADDKIENRYVLINFFKLLGPDAGIEIIESSSAAEAIEKIIEEKPSLVLMDINMETNDAGIFALKSIRSTPEVADTQIWALTAKIINSQDTSGIKGFDDYIMKPFDLVELLIKASKFLNIEIPEKLKQRMGIK
ncbi:MAG: hypothetical protein A2086_07985 [Spirochaetes bacterium GWD1_27_9]|nr:MAG: hypothetical protein A2Z98_07115 [Spirochaetes bacterium GWB1_27_13]OHD34461.1 MAG: hypothetical protein A2086_07985 [Spirochaetes bacterium GWD1_27_9]